VCPRTGTYTHKLHRVLTVDPVVVTGHLEEDREHCVHANRVCVQSAKIYTIFCFFSWVVNIQLDHWTRLVVYAGLRWEEV